MVFESGSLNATLVLAADGDSTLSAELRRSFIGSARQQLNLMQRARCDANRNIAALRLQGIAASFHARSLLELANVALSGAPGDPVIVRRIATFLDQLTQR